MEMSNTRVVPAARERVWEALNDPAILKECIPGCEAFEPDGDNAYRATVAAKIGPVSARFTGRLLLSNINPPSGYTLVFEGAGGSVGHAKGEAKVALLSTADDHTEMSYAVKAQVGGKLAQIGSRLIDGAASHMADDFFTRFVESLSGPVRTVELEGSVDQAAAERPRARQGNSGIWKTVLAVGVLIVFLAYAYFKL